jgi:hypothetical protein
MNKPWSKLVLGFFSACTLAFGQNQTKHVLFIGNSYTYVNNLPQMVADIASSMGDNLVYDSNTPGGYYLYDHFYNTTSVNKIKQGNWDYVVLQEQSQAPSLPPYQLDAVFEYAHKLDSIVCASDSCVETVFYMTWGRKNGDATLCSVYTGWPYVCTYQGMDSLLNLRYRMLADTNHAIVSPIGAVWNYIRKNYPSIELYQTDESHPSLAGTYAGACCFYAALFRKDPTLITFNPGLSVADVIAIRNAVKVMTYDSLLKWNIGKYDSIMNTTCSQVDIREVTANLSVSVSPNPVTEMLIIQSAQKGYNTRIRIYNIYGVFIKDMEVETGRQINITDLSEGVYYIRTDPNASNTLKFIKQ